MKSSLLSILATAFLFISTAASAAPAFDHGNNPRRPSPIEKARYEAAQRESEHRAALEQARFDAQRQRQIEQQRQLAAERARVEAQRRADQQRAAERARWEAQHRHNGR